MSFASLKWALAGVALAGVVVQGYYALGRGQALGSFLSYFTILTNLLVVASVGWRRASWEAALAVYICVVGATYFLILRHVWHPVGLEKYADQVLHYAVPGGYLLTWLWLGRKERLAWGSVGWWMLYPAGYSVYTLVRGPWVGWYPYPFVDVTQLGYARALGNAAGILGVFAVLSLAVVAYTRKRFTASSSSSTPRPGLRGTSM